MDNFRPEDPLPFVSRAEVDFLDQLIQRVFELLFHPDVAEEDRRGELGALVEVYQFDYDSRIAPERTAEPSSPRITKYWQRYRACTSASGAN